MPAVIQRSFGAGEVSPRMYGRADMVPYGIGLRTMRNMYGLKEGGASKRPGTKHIRPMGIPGTKSFTFIYNEAQAYHLELGWHPDYSGGAGTIPPEGRGYIRFTRDQVTLVLPPGASTDAPAWVPDIAYAARALVSLGVYHYYCMVAHTDVASSHAPDSVNGELYWYRLPVNPDVTNGSIYEIPTPYGTNLDPTSGDPYGMADIWTAYSTQTADIMIFTNRRPATDDLGRSDYPPYLLRRFGNLSWDFVPAPFKPDLNGPHVTNASFPLGAPGYGYYYRYKISSIDKSGRESLVGPCDSINMPVAWPTGKPNPPGLITGGGTLPISLDTTTDHKMYAFDELIITGLTCSSGPVNKELEAVLLNQIFSIERVGGGAPAANGTNASTVMKLLDTEGLPVVANHTATWERVYIELEGYNPATGAAALSTLRYIQLEWTAVPGAVSYSIYKEDPEASGIYGFLGTSVSTVFKDIGVPPDMSESPIRLNLQFLTDGNQPAVAGFFDQRLALANSHNRPQTIWLSRSGDLFNFTRRTPIQDDDAITAPLASRQVNEIRHLVELEDMLVLTRGAEGLLTGAADEAVTPTTVRYKSQGYRGAAPPQPLEITDVILYAQARGNTLLEIKRGEFGGYVPGVDPAVFSSHFFGSACGCAIVAMAWAERPDSIVWVIRADGMALAMAFVPGQQVRSWSRHDTRGAGQHYFKDVVVIPEGSVDTPYFTVARLIPGADPDEVEYLEAMTQRCGACES